MEDTSASTRDTGLEESPKARAFRANDREQIDMYFECALVIR